MCRVTSTTQLLSSWDIYRLQAGCASFHCTSPSLAAVALRPSTRGTLHVTCDGDFWRSLAIIQSLEQLSEMAGGKVLNGT